MEEGQLKVCWNSVRNKKNESFLAYFMRILNPCVDGQDSILQTGVKRNF